MRAYRETAVPLFFVTGFSGLERMLMNQKTPGHALAAFRLAEEKAAHGAAVERAGRALERWYCAQLHTDGHWTAICGRAA